MYKIRFDAAGGAHSAPQGTLTGFEGPTSKGREGNGWEGKGEGEEKEEREKEGKGEGEGGEGREG